MGLHNKIDLTKVSEPTWLKEVSQTSCVNARDLAEMFGISSSTLYAYIKEGKLPKPDATSFEGKMFNEHTKCNKLLWRISTIRKFFNTKGITK